MILSDFEWCGQSGSQFGLIPCRFEAPGLETNESGATLEFTMIHAPGSDRQRPLSGRYTDILTGTFQVCKNPETTASPYFSAEDIRFFNRWLNRRDGYHKFKYRKKGEDSEHRILSSSLRKDNVMKYFNFGWLDIMNTYENRNNTYSSNLPCTITMIYSPVAKIGL